MMDFLVTVRVSVDMAPDAAPARVARKLRSRVRLHDGQGLGKLGRIEAVEADATPLPPKAA